MLLDFAQILWTWLHDIFLYFTIICLTRRQNRFWFMWGHNKTTTTSTACCCFCLTNVTFEMVDILERLSQTSFKMLKGDLFIFSTHLLYFIISQNIIRTIMLMIHRIIILYICKHFRFLNFIFYLQFHLFSISFYVENAFFAKWHEILQSLPRTKRQIIV